MECELAEGSVAADELRLLIERIERLEEEKKAIADDVRDVYAEAKARGYDPKTMRTVVRLRKMENHAREEAEALLETYKAAASDWHDEPTGRSCNIWASSPGRSCGANIFKDVRGTSGPGERRPRGRGDRAERR